MRILMLTDWCANEGGTERSLAWLRDGLRRAGDEVRVLTSSAGSAAGGTADYVALGSERPGAQLLLQVVNPSAVRQVRRARSTFQPDVAMVWMFEMHLSPAALLALRGVPTVGFVLYPKPVCPTARRVRPDGSLCTSTAGSVCWRCGCVSVQHWLRDRPRYRLIHAALREMSAVLTCSDTLTADLRAIGVGAETIDLAVPRPGDAFVRRPAEEPLFVFVGRLSPEKGVDLLLRAFARLHASHPRARLRVVGDGPMRAELDELTCELGLTGAGTVEFTGYRRPEEVERELADAWALVAPSRWAEPFGLVAVEAVVRGVPVVASETGGFAGTLEPGVTGLLFPNGDEDALLDRLEAVASGRAFPDRVPAAAAVARARQRHDLDRHVAAVRGRVEEVLAA